MKRYSETIHKLATELKDAETLSFGEYNDASTFHVEMVTRAKIRLAQTQDADMTLLAAEALVVAQRVTDDLWGLAGSLEIPLGMPTWKWAKATATRIQEIRSPLVDILDKMNKLHVIKEEMKRKHLIRRARSGRSGTRRNGIQT